MRGGLCGDRESRMSASVMLTPFFRPSALKSVPLSPHPAQLFAIVPIGGSRGNVLELAPWTWKGGRAVDPGVYNNVFDDLDTSPVSAHDCCALQTRPKKRAGHSIVPGTLGALSGANGRLAIAVLYPMDRGGGASFSRRADVHC